MSQKTRIRTKQDSQRVRGFRVLFRIAIRNVLRHWRHSLATILAIASSFTAVSIFDGFLQELYTQLDDGYAKRGMLGDILIQKEGSKTGWQEDFWSYTLNKDLQAKIATFLAGDAQPLVKESVRFLHVSGMIGGNASQSLFIGYGYDLKTGAEIRGKRWAWNALAGKPLHFQDKAGIAIGHALANSVGCHIDVETPSYRPEGGFVPEFRPFSCTENPLSLTASTKYSQINAIKLRVDAILDGGLRAVDERLVHMSLANAQTLLDTDDISMISVELVNQKDSKKFIRLFTETFASLGVEAMSWHDHQFGELRRGSQQVLNMYRNVFMIIIVIVSIMAVANTMMKSISERTVEIGSLRSFGFRSSEIRWLFTAEGSLLAILACLIGLLATLILTILINALHITYNGGILSLPMYLVVHLAPTAWLRNGLILALVAGFASRLTSGRITRLKIADLLRQEKA